MSRSWLTREEVRAVDQRAVDEFGLSGLVLMENAGRGCADLIEGGPVVVCCGKGNNGGDGYVIARHLEARGLAFLIVSVCDLTELKGDARVNADIAVRCGIEIVVADTAGKWEELGERLQSAGWLVDALLGTGFKGELREPYLSAIRAIREAAVPVLAVDLPSGLDADSGMPAQCCVQATLTATFVAEKQGFLQESAKAWLGQVIVLPIGVPRALLSSCRFTPE